MCLIFSLFPATIFVLIGYFVLFSSSKAEGKIRIFGIVLAIWLFIIAAFFPICGAYVTLSGSCPMEEIIQNMEIPMKLPIE
jgi:predicted acyltransferase